VAEVRRVSMGRLQLERWAKKLPDTDLETTMVVLLEEKGRREVESRA
jgi:hypothetical protein